VGFWQALAGGAGGPESGFTQLLSGGRQRRGALPTQTANGRTRVRAGVLAAIFSSGAGGCFPGAWTRLRARRRRVVGSPCLHAMGDHQPSVDSGWVTRSGPAPRSVAPDVGWNVRGADGGCGDGRSAPSQPLGGALAPGRQRGVAASMRYRTVAGAQRCCWTRLHAEQRERGEPTSCPAPAIAGWNRTAVSVAVLGTDFRARADETLGTQSRSPSPDGSPRTSCRDARGRGRCLGPPDALSARVPAGSRWEPMRSR